MLHPRSYSSPVVPHSLPVSHFSYQEPENDPRSFCYLWVARCNGLASATALSDSMHEYVAGSVADIGLYQLAFDQKTFIEGGPALFTVRLVSSVVQQSRS